MIFRSPDGAQRNPGQQCSLIMGSRIALLGYFARLRAGQLFRRTPTRHPSLHLIERNSEPGPFEFVEAAVVFADIWLGQFHDRVSSEGANQVALGT